MDGERLDRERERARGNPTREAILDMLGAGELTTPEIRLRLPDDRPLSAISYHLRILEQAKLVGCDDGVYRLA
jgi:DNA-binding transcriptional ArsR family regulator